MHIGKLFGRRDVLAAVLLALFPTLFATPVGAAARAPLQVPIFSAAPEGMEARSGVAANAQEKGDTWLLGNGLLSAEISSRSGVVNAIENRITGQRHALVGDSTGINDWRASEATPHQFVTRTEPSGDGRDARIVLEERSNDRLMRIIYTLGAGDFWLRRQVTVVPTAATPHKIDRIIYGKLDVEGAQRKQLDLGKFDRPSILKIKSGGLFAGVEHWFYSVGQDGIYENTSMGWEQTGAFETEPWYIGVFAEEPGEPYPGWMWYRTYLQRAKQALAKHDAWFSWNAGWGQWGVDIDDPAAGQYLALMKRLGINGVIFGSGGFGKGIDKFAQLAASDAMTKTNVAALKNLGIAGGTLNNGSKPWTDADKQPALLDELQRYIDAGFRSTAFDFFESKDTYAAHHGVANYFRMAHDKLDYTECHLGMAAYGPQFQRLVRVNHPDDIHGFDISHFSSNWATFLAFRKSRRDWQQKYEYLMPEDGLYYYLTHYANWGNPRRYTDPEPQQLTYSVHAYCGIGFNFHDIFGWRESIAAASAFTTAPVFGHIELKMPPRDEAYASRFFAWMKENAAIIGTSRVCVETETHCVLSKIRDGKGLIYIVNYHPGEASLAMPLKTGHAGPLSIRQVYPAREEARPMKDGDVLQAKVRGESTMIFEVNGALKSLPPENRTRFPIDLAMNAQPDHFTAQFTMPDVREALNNADDPALPKELLSLDQVQDSRPDLLVSIPADEDKNIPAVKWIGKGKLPKEFLDVYGFKNGETVETWKIVPWAYADRIWLVVRPDKPVPLTGPQPTTTVNGAAVSLVPRIDHRFDNVSQWNCPLYHADITQSVRFGENNDVLISIPQQTDAPIASVMSAADRN